jgi:hypothetical protein
MADRERIIAAWEVWRDAQKAYRDEAAKYIVMWWGDEPPPTGPEPVTLEALAELSRLREAEGAALAAWRDVLGES